MAAGEWNPTIEQGASWVRDLVWESGGAPVDLTGWTAAMTLRDALSDRASLHLSTASGQITITDAAAGRFRLALSAAETSALPARKHRYDLELTGSGTRRLLMGVITVSREMTREGDGA